jgi:hypothetical protein
MPIVIGILGVAVTICGATVGAAIGSFLGGSIGCMATEHANAKAEIIELETK